MKIVDIKYYVIFGKNDYSDWLEYDVKLTDKEEAIYNEAVKNKIPLCDVAELEPALERVYKEIEEVELENLEDFDIPLDEGLTIHIEFVDPNE